MALGVIAARVKYARGRLVTARALVDEGSDTSMATLAFTRKLGLKERRRQLRIPGVTGERKEMAEQLSLRLLTGIGQGHTVNVWTGPRLCEADCLELGAGRIDPLNRNKVGSSAWAHRSAGIE